VPSTGTATTEPWWLEVHVEGVGVREVVVVQQGVAGGSDVVELVLAGKSGPVKWSGNVDASVNVIGEAADAFPAVASIKLAVEARRQTTTLGIVALVASRPPPSGRLPS
jgi:hypothetical protein